MDEAVGTPVGKKICATPGAPSTASAPKRCSAFRSH